MTSPAASVYRIFQRASGAADSVRAAVIGLVLAATALTTVGVVRVAREHEVLGLGYQLSRESVKVRELREAHRQLQLELATLTAPDRIRRLATELGMTEVAPDRIRVIDVAAHEVAAMMTARPRPRECAEPCGDRVPRDKKVAAQP
jgi:cell division protein FtsL